MSLLENLGRHNARLALGVGLLSMSVLMGCGGGSAGTGTSTSSSSSSGSSSSASFPASILAEMSPGINLGNSMEVVAGAGPYSTSQETGWGNPPVNQAIFNAYAAAGFKSVRIPMAWSEYADANGNIAPFWLARVTQVVNYARNAGLDVVINIHWDGGWIDAQSSLQAGVQAKMTNFWTQIANNFKTFDNHLMFAGMNEVGDSANAGNPTPSDCSIQQSYNQTFVNAVRATGGNNSTRPLVVQGYYTNIDETLTCNATLPADTAPSALIMEIHYYDPYDFTLNGSSNIWQWGSIATDPSATETWANESYVDAQFQKLTDTFVNKGVPVIMGEYGAYNKPAYPGMSTYTQYWDQYVTHSAVQHGVVPIYWDTGGLFDRSTGNQLDPTTISTIIKAAQ